MIQPLVTCLCLTTVNRKAFLERALQCFLGADYPRKELLIVADSLEQAESLSTGEYAGQINQHEIILSRLFVLEDDLSSSNVGAKRNEGCSRASGEIIAVWDDDDYYAPDRLTQQVEFLQRSGKQVTGYSGAKFTDGAGWWQFQYPESSGLVIGSSLMFTREWWTKHPFPEIQTGEDAGFCEAAARAGELAVCPDLNLMYCSIHPRNTSIRKPGQSREWVKLPGFEWSATNVTR